MIYYLGIDQSKRSTGCVLLNDKGELHSFRLICNSELDNEDMLIYQFAELSYWISENIDEVEDSVKGLIEGLSFGSVGSGKDFLAGIFWYLKARFKTLYGGDYGGFLGTVPVSMWRSKVLTKEEQKEAKASGKDGLKWAVFNKLSATTRKQFADYVEMHKDQINKAKDPKIKAGSKSKKYTDAMWDLADAHMIAQHCFKQFIND